MKYTILALVLLLTFACSKIDKGTTAVPIAQEDNIKFTTNIDTGNFNVIDTLPLSINITSKIPSKGVIYSVAINWIDSSKQIYKIDSSTTSSSLNLNILGIKKSGNYSASITVSSKSTSSNSETKTLSITKSIYSLKTFNYDIDVSGLDFGQFGLAGQIDQTVSQTILYATNNGTEHIITNPAYVKTAPPFHFILKNNSWVFEGKYEEAAMDGFRNYDPTDKNGTFVIANHGNEVSNPWPLGDVFVVKTNGEKLNWIKVSKGKSFYHSAAGGDLDGDGLFDISGVHMGTYDNWFEGPHLYKQNSDGSFSQTRDFMDTVGFIGRNLGLGATLITDVVGNSKKELITAEYGFNTTFNKNFNERYGLAIWGYDNVSKKLKNLSYLKEIGIYSNPDRGTTSIKVSDIDKDGDRDILVAVEGSDEVNAVQIFKNDGAGNFKPGQIISFSFSNFQFREFELVDINNDGFDDILFHSFHYGSFFRINPNNIYAGVKLQNNIWINNSGTFLKYANEINIPNIRPGYLKGFYINGKVKFIGFGEPDKRVFSFDNRFKLYEITLNLF